MGNNVDFLRLHVDSLAAPAALEGEVEAALEVGDPRPTAGESCGGYLARLAIELGFVASTQAFARSLSGAKELYEPMRVALFGRLDSIIREHGDLSLLGFLLESPSRDDVEQHLARIPAAARALAHAKCLFCLSPQEVAALGAAVRAANSSEVAEWCDALFSAPLGEGEFDLWLIDGDHGEVDLDALPAQRGPAAKAPAVRTTVMATGRDVGAAAFIALVIGLSIGGCIVFLRSCSSKPTSSPAPKRTAAPAAAAGFSCFSWVHGPESYSTDCYRTASDCDKAREDMNNGARPTSAACRLAERAWCVVGSRPPAQKEFESFGDPGACERYRTFTSKSGHNVSACAVP